MITPLPEPHYFVVVGYDGRETHQPYYLLSDLERYGEAEYQRGIEAAAQVCTGIALTPSNCILGVAVECAQAIRKLGVFK